MKAAVVCANGRVGSLVVKEAVERGLDVTAIVRGENRTVAKNVVQKDLFDLTTADLEGFDVVVDAFGAWAPEAKAQGQALAELRERNDVQWTFISSGSQIN